MHHRLSHYKIILWTVSSSAVVWCFDYWAEITVLSSYHQKRGDFLQRQEKAGWPERSLLPLYPQRGSDELVWSSAPPHATGRHWEQSLPDRHYPTLNTITDFIWCSHEYMIISNWFHFKNPNICTEILSESNILSHPQPVRHALHFCLFRFKSRLSHSERRDLKEYYRRTNQLQKWQQKASIILCVIDS